MEKKKLLFVAISVGVFLAFTIGAAILIFAPPHSVPTGPATMANVHPGTGITVTPPQPQPVVPPIVAAPPPVYTGIPQPVDAVGLVRGTEDMPGIRQLPEGVIQQPDGFHVQGRPAETVITVHQPTRAAVPVTPPASNAAPRAAPAAPPPRQPVQAAPVQRVTPPPAQARPAPAAAPAAVAQPRQAPPSRASFDYWIQTGAFSTVTNAEGVRTALSDKGIASIIENRLIDGRHLFRVRVGPYTSANEANYWLALIQSIDGFEDSQVRQTIRQ